MKSGKSKKGTVLVKKVFWVSVGRHTEVAGLGLPSTISSLFFHFGASVNLPFFFVLSFFSPNNLGLLFCPWLLWTLHFSSPPLNSPLLPVLPPAAFPSRAFGQARARLGTTMQAALGADHHPVKPLNSKRYSSLYIYICVDFKIVIHPAIQCGFFFLVGHRGGQFPRK